MSRIKNEILNEINNMQTDDLFEYALNELKSGIEPDLETLKSNLEDFEETTNEVYFDRTTELAIEYSMKVLRLYSLSTDYI